MNSLMLTTADAVAIVTYTNSNSYQDRAVSSTELRHEEHCVLDITSCFSSPHRQAEAMLLHVKQWPADNNQSFTDVMLSVLFVMMSAGTASHEGPTRSRRLT